MITLSSDFGTPYPAVMRGVILERTDARLVDVSHEFPRQDVRSSAFWLREVLPWFPPAVHLVVVDPGVGTDRHAIVIRAGDHALVGPDNGVLIPAARRLVANSAHNGPTREAPRFEVFRLREGEATDDAQPWPPVPKSSTFHGRDVFAPAAARVHELGIGSVEGDDGFEPTDEFVDIELPRPSLGEREATGEVLAIDAFGNVITNVPGDAIGSRFGATLGVNGTTWPVRRSYAGVHPGAGVVTVGSHENVELATNQGRGDETFGLQTGDTVRLTW